MQETKEYDPHDYNRKQESINMEETAMKILECFDNKDANALKDMFAESIKAEYDLNSQIETAFEIYGSNSISSEFKHGGYGASESRNGRSVMKNLYAYIKNIKMDNNDVFSITFSKCILDDKNSANLGLNEFVLSDPEYGALARIGRINSDDQLMQFMEDNNNRRNQDRFKSYLP